MERSPTTGTTYGVPARRKEIAARLSEAYSRDMLDQREFESRLEQVEAALTMEQLEALVADFGPDKAPTDLPTLPEKRVVSVLSDLNQVLVPGVQDGYRALTWLGDVRLDLRSYRGSGRTVVLEISGGLGDIGIQVPHGTRVLYKGRTILGEYRQVPAKKPGQMKQLWDRLFGSAPVPSSSFPSDGPPPTLILEGTRWLGDVTIREEAP